MSDRSITIDLYKKDRSFKKTQQKNILAMITLQFLMQNMML